MIPDFKCKDGCHECCGPIHWSSVEDMVIKKYMKKHNIEDVHWTVEQYIENNLLCPYIKDNKCVIYPVRPIVCRLQGHVKQLPCPHSAGFDMSRRQQDEIMRRYDKLNYNWRLDSMELEIKKIMGKNKYGIK